MEALVSVGVSEIILAVNVEPEQMLKYLRELEQFYNIKIHLSKEESPMGTAGPLALAKKYLDQEDGSDFFVLNSDVICEFPFKELLEFHRAHNHEGSIVVTQVNDPSKYGVVLFDNDNESPDAKGRIQRFVEKPQRLFLFMIWLQIDFVGDKINAGIYLFKPSILKRIELRPTSIEREIFPAVAADGQLHAFVLPGYWMDIGQPKDYLSGSVLHLNSLAKKSPEVLAQGSNIIGNVLIHPSAIIAQDSLLGPDVVIGPNVVVQSGARISRSTLLEGVKVERCAWLKSTLVGWKSTIGKWARLEAGTVIGEDVQIGDDVLVSSAIIFPHKGVKDNTKIGEIIY